MNRTIQPKYSRIDTIDIQQAKVITLSNGIKVYTIDAGDNDILKVDFVFDAGTKYQDKSLIASTTNSLMQEGTINYNSEQIAEKFDFYGAFWNRFIDRDFAGFTLYTLTKYDKETLEIAREIIFEPAFIDKELETYLIKQKQQFEIEQTKVNTLARNKYTQVVFGEEHIYGKVAKLKDFDLITKEDLIQFHKTYYETSEFQIFISGKISDQVLEDIEQLFGSAKKTKQLKKAFEPIQPSSEKRFFVQKDDAVQASIRIGKASINKHHRDYPGFNVLSTILGGYFGSRLITNIREDKGYTYGIYSVLHSLKEAGNFAIMTEVGNEVSQEAVKEIYFEIDRLKTEFVPEEELQLVKNYMMGDLLRSFDGPFAISESVRSMVDYGLNYDYFSNFITEIKNIDSKRIMELANTYFEEDSFYEVVVGNKQE